MAKRLLVASVGVLGFAAAANAADIYVAPAAGGYKDAAVYAPSWTGFYAGVNGGYGWTSDDANITLYNAGKTFHVPGRTSEGGVGGGQIGYNWQPLAGGGFKDGPAYGNLVFGIEADFNGSGISQDYTASIIEFRNPTTVKTNLDYFGTVRGRLGYTWDGTLFYGTGGFAYGRVHNRIFDATGSLSYSGVLTGYAAGAGIERKLTPNLSAKIEYLHLDLGDYRSTDGTGSAVRASSGDISAEFDIVRAGLNYSLGAIYEPLK
jgi:outer membrane immunogenic protein